MDYPREIERLHGALRRLPGMLEVESGIESLQGLTAEDLRFPDFAHLPLGALRRTSGGLSGEALIQFEFALAPNAASWLSLEFLAWFIRDQARGGHAIQLHPLAFPPAAGTQIQLGTTLRWQIDLFCLGTGADLSPQLATVESIAEALEAALRVYGHLLPSSG
jgi:hypothetical protein